MSRAALADQPAYFDRRIGMEVHTVLPGEHKVIPGQGGALMTLLGSCVAACIRDPKSETGGLNHFLLPEDKSNSAAGSARYGVYAMEVLLNDILRRGALRSQLEAKVFGAGNVLRSKSISSVGARNAAFVKEFLRNEGITITGEDLGGDHARRVIYIPKTGKAFVQRTSPALEQEVFAADDALNTRVPAKPTNAIELF